MNEAIDTAMENVLKLIRTNIKADDALKYSQSAANLSRVREVYFSIDRETTTKKRASA